MQQSFSENLTRMRASERSFENNQKPILVLDLDETLLHTENGIINPRPGAFNFVKMLSKKFNIMIFTAGTREYASRCLHVLQITPYVNFVLSRENMTRENGHRKKILSPFLCKHCLQETFVVDDMATKVWHDPYISRSHMINIKPFNEVDPQDQQLQVTRNELEKKTSINKLYQFNLHKTT